MDGDRKERGKSFEKHEEQHLTLEDLTVMKLMEEIMEFD